MKANKVFLIAYFLGLLHYTNANASFALQCEDLFKETISSHKQISDETLNLNFKRSPVLDSSFSKLIVRTLFEQKIKLPEAVEKNPENYQSHIQGCPFSPVFEITFKNPQIQWQDEKEGINRFHNVTWIKDPTSEVQNSKWSYVKWDAPFFTLHKSDPAMVSNEQVFTILDNTLFGPFQNITNHSIDSIHHNYGFSMIPYQNKIKVDTHNWQDLAQLAEQKRLFVNGKIYPNYKEPGIYSSSTPLFFNDNNGTNWAALVMDHDQDENIIKKSNPLTYNDYNKAYINGKLVDFSFKKKDGKTFQAPFRKIKQIVLLTENRFVVIGDIRQEDVDIQDDVDIQEQEFNNDPKSKLLVFGHLQKKYNEKNINEELPIEITQQKLNLIANTDTENNENQSLFNYVIDGYHTFYFDWGIQTSADASHWGITVTSHHLHSNGAVFDPSTRKLTFDPAKGLMRDYIRSETAIITDGKWTTLDQNLELTSTIQSLEKSIKNMNLTSPQFSSKGQHWISYFSNADRVQPQGINAKFMRTGGLRTTEDGGIFIDGKLVYATNKMTAEHDMFIDDQGNWYALQRALSSPGNPGALSIVVGNISTGEIQEHGPYKEASVSKSPLILSEKNWALAKFVKFEDGKDGVFFMVNGQLIKEFKNTQDFAVEFVGSKWFAIRSSNETDTSELYFNNADTPVLSVPSRHSKIFVESSNQKGEWVALVYENEMKKEFIAEFKNQSENKKQGLVSLFFEKITYDKAANKNKTQPGTWNSTLVNKSKKIIFSDGRTLPFPRNGEEPFLGNNPYSIPFRINFETGNYILSTVSKTGHQIYINDKLFGEFKDVHLVATKNPNQYLLYAIEKDQAKVSVTSIQL